MENLRNIYLYVAAVEKGVEYPGSQAGIADMISAARDEHRWDPSAFWHWNLRMQIAANIGAGLTELNEPYFNLYRENLANIENWTKEHMKGLPGVCVPETMRFNGPGIEYEGAWQPDRHGFELRRELQALLQRADDLDRRRGVAVGVAAIPRHQRPQVSCRELSVDGSRCALSSCLPESRPGRAAAYKPLERARDAVGRDRSDDGRCGDHGSCIRRPFEAAKVLGKDPDLVRQIEAALPKIPALPRTQASGAAHTVAGFSRCARRRM